MSRITQGPHPADGTAPSGRADTARARLMAAAIEAFAAKGFHGTTTRDIAAAAGMSPAALYVHHRSKEDLLYLLSRAGHEETLQLVQDAIAASDDPREQLITLVRDFVRHHAISHTSARIVNYELHALTPEHLREISAIRRDIDAGMRRVIEAGVRTGAFTTPDPPMTALALLSLGIDVARWYRDDGRWSPGDVADHYCELALRMVGAEA
ncbi:TetR family transcriptional regulator [Micromonospora sp. NBC_01638]|uniref:TetR family transcriptional regulator n=1 Tax=Micromonospora sp. NBC_01638 TaxID=2975982 RepID=UPI003868A835|nr:TetR family transcriptional regulator [Micromonospora sp. NBC_01638]